MKHAAVSSEFQTPSSRRVDLASDPPHLPHARCSLTTHHHIHHINTDTQHACSCRVDLASDPASCSLTTHHHIYHINTDTQHACSCRVDLAFVNSRPTSRSPTAAWQVVARAPAGRQAGVVISTARRYASSRSSCGPVSRCLSVCLSQVGVLSKRLYRFVLFFARTLWTCLALCCKKIQVSAKIRVLPSGTFSQTPDLENFATPY